MRRPAVFLSSTFSDDFGVGREAVPLRRRILDAVDRLPVDLWAYELAWHAVSPGTTDIDADTIIDRCFEGIKTCDLFVFIVSGRHGTGAGLLEEQISASYFELELFAAALLEKPILILHYRNREPEPLLLDAMRILRQSFPSSAYRIDDEAALFQHFQEACRALVDSRSRNGPHAAADLPEGVSLCRTRQRMEKDLANPSLLFLDGQMSSRARRPDPDKAKALIEHVATGVRGVGEGQRVMPHGAAMFRLWAAMRELMAESMQETADPHIAALWDRAFGLWAGKASWFGLHGHTWMGPLAAVNSQIDLRKRMRADPRFSTHHDLREPTGARASALYSIAQRMQTRARKLFHYRQVVALACEAIEHDPTGREGARSIRAHALVQMARLGHVWKIWEAKADFERSLSIREAKGASEASIGEAKADLGLLLVQIRQRRRGLALVEEGVAQMRSNTSVDGKAFLARGLRKLALAAQQAGRRDLELAARDELSAVSNEVEAIDQLRGLPRATAAHPSQGDASQTGGPVGQPRGPEAP